MDVTGVTGISSNNCTHVSFFARMLMRWRNHTPALNSSVMSQERGGSRGGYRYFIQLASSAHNLVWDASLTGIKPSRCWGGERWEWEGQRLTLVARLSERGRPGSQRTVRTRQDAEAMTAPEPSGVGHGRGVPFSPPFHPSVVWCYGTGVSARFCLLNRVFVWNGE